MLGGRNGTRVRRIALAVWVLAALLGGRLAVQTWRASGEPAHGFVTHWVASRLVLRGEPIARFYDDVWFNARVDEVEPGVSDIFGANPPTVALAVTPVAWLDYAPARRVVALGSLLIWLGAAVWLGRVLALPAAWAGLLVCLATMFQPAIEGLRHAQLHIPVFALLLVAWRSWRNGTRADSAIVETHARTAQSWTRALSTGVPLGAALALKAAGGVLWLLLLAQRRWRSLLAGGAVVTVLVLITLALSGVSAWTAFRDRANVLRASGSLTVTAYQSLPGMVRRLTSPDTRWNPAPLLDAPVAGSLIAGLLVLALVAMSMMVAARRPPVDALFAAFAALAVAVSPVSLDYHYVICLLPIAVLLARLRAEAWRTQGVLLLGAVLLIGADLPYRSPRLADGWLVVLAYPKLCGALLLWALAMHDARRRPVPAR